MTQKPRLSLRDPDAPRFDDVFSKFEEARAAQSNAKRELILARMIANDPDSAEVDCAIQRMRRASARVDAINEEIEDLILRIEVRKS